jgi:DNA-binding CsgD family transcriptional regulator
MIEKISWLHICPADVQTEAKSILDRVSSSLSVEFCVLTSISELFPLLSNPSFNSDYITIDLHALQKFTQNTDTVDEYELLNTLNILIKSTLYRKNSGKISKRQTKLGVTLDSTVDSILLKEIVNIPAISFVTLTPMTNHLISHNDIVESLKDILTGETSVNKKILDLVKKRKPVVIDTSPHVKMTTRQRQVYSLVINRAASNKIIAKTLGITESTVKLHMSSILKKYGVRNRTQLVLFSKDHKE